MVAPLLMKTIVPITALALLFASACTNSGNDPRTDALEGRIKELEAEVVALHKNDTAVRLLIRRTVDVSHFNNSPWENFLNADEFWENTYDVNPFACLDQCMPAARAAERLCYNFPPGTDRDDCLKRANMQVIGCIDGCPSVHGIGGLGGRPQ